MWRLVGLLFVIACGSTTRTSSPPPSTAPVFAASVLDKPAFTATPSELLQFGRSAPAGDWTVVILRDEEHADFDERGVVTQTMRTVMLMREHDEIVREYRYDASVGKPPTIRARVIHADRSVTELDPAAISETSDVGDLPGYVLHTLSYDPELMPGDILEEVVTQTTRPALGTDNYVRHLVGWTDAPVMQTRVVLSAPTTLTPAHAARRVTGARETVTEADGRTSWTWELGYLKPIKDTEQDVPAEWESSVAITISTGLPWKQLAGSYQLVVDRALAAKPAWPKDLPRPTAPSPEAAVEIAAWISSGVIATHVDFDEGSSLPQPADVTMNNGGSNLDRAVLLVALLRDVGIAAELVLVDSAVGSNLLADIPSLRAFDHVLVHAGDAWFCLDDEGHETGALGESDRDRAALVIAPGTTGLTRTPGSTRDEHGTRQVRTYRLAEVGGASVTEITTEEGDIALARRSEAITTLETEYDEFFAEYARNKYSGTLSNHSLIAGSEGPTRLALEVESAQRYVTQLGTIELDVYPSEVLAEVPVELRDELATSTRVAPFYWRVPHTFEIEHRFELPTGFVLPPLPPDSTQNLGAKVTLTERWRAEGTTLVGEYKLATGQGTMTAVEAAQLRAALVALYDKPTHVTISHQAWDLLAKGQPAEAFAALEALVKAHPKDAIHRRRLSRMLLDHTLGAKSQRVARDAVKVAPSDAESHLALGTALEHDRFARFHGTGWDRAGALAAYAKARQLDPTHAEAARQHARLLMTGTNGIELEAGSQVAEAAVAWRAAYAIDQSQESGDGWVQCLLHSTRASEALDVIPTLAPGPFREGIWIASLAVARSTEAALAKVDELPDDEDRKKAIEGATRELVRLREYTAARAVAAKFAQSIGNSMFKAVPNLKAVSATKPKSKDPRDVALAALDASVTPIGTAWAWDAKTADEIVQAQGRDAQMEQAIELYGTAAVRDFFLSLFTFNSVGEPTGPFRVELAVGFLKNYYFVALDRGTAKVIGSPIAPQGIGRHVARLVKAGALDEAGQIVEWFAPLATTTDMQNVLTGLTRTKEHLELAATLLAWDLTMPREPFVRCQADTTRSDAARASCASFAALADANRVATLAQQRKFADAETLVGTITEPAQAARARLELLTRKGDLGGAIAFGEARLKEAPSRAFQNLVAWLYLVTGGDLERALTLATESIGDSPAKAPRNVLNTRAAILVELGRFQPAREDLLQAFFANHRRDASSDVYVYARIAERVGYPAEATALYQEVARSKNDNPVAEQALAKQRLAALRAP